jgi:hypothetical protein
MVINCFLDENDDDYTVNGMSTLFLVEFIITLAPLVLALLFVSDRPPTAPSQSTQLKTTSTAATTVTESVTGVDDSLHQVSTSASHSFFPAIFYFILCLILSQVNPLLSNPNSSPSPALKDTPQNDEQMDLSSFSWRQTISFAQTLFQDRNFVTLFVTFSIIVGLLNSLLTLFNQVLEPLGYRRVAWIQQSYFLLKLYLVLFLL